MRFRRPMLCFPSLDAATPKAFQAINRLVKSLRIEKIIKGLRALQTGVQERDLALEVMLVGRRKRRRYRGHSKGCQVHRPRPSPAQHRGKAPCRARFTFERGEDAGSFELLQ